MARLTRTKCAVLVVAFLVVGCSRAPLPTATPGTLAIPQESVIEAEDDAAVEATPTIVPTATATTTPTVEPTEPATPLPTAEIETVEENSAESGDDFIEENDAPAPEVEATQPITYIVQAGDALELIALSFGVDLFTLAEANNITEFDQIEIGQELLIPTADFENVAVDEPTGSSELVEYIVEPGDALSLLAERFEITTAELAAANGLSVTDELFIGQVLLIPNQ